MEELAMMTQLGFELVPFSISRFGSQFKPTASGGKRGSWLNGEVLSKVIAAIIRSHKNTGYLCEQGFSCQIRSKSS